MQVRGKKNLVIEKALSGPIGIFVKFSTLQEHGVDKVFYLENDNVDISQKNVVFLARGEAAANVQAIAGMYLRLDCHRSCLNQPAFFSMVCFYAVLNGWDHKVDYVDTFLLCIISLDPNIDHRVYIPTRSIAYTFSHNRISAIITC